jgi:probable addiction module antidote protein
MRRNLSYKADLLEDLRNDAGYAAEYLSAAILDSREAFLVALRDVAESNKGIARVAREAEVNRESLYRALSKSGNPTLNTLGSLLDALGFYLRVEPKQVAGVPLAAELGIVPAKGTTVTITNIPGQIENVTTHTASILFNFSLPNSGYQFLGEFPEIPGPIFAETRTNLYQKRFIR